MNEENVLTPDQRIQEELTAYLDGELDAESSDRVERRLADEPAYREQLRRLQQAWDLLDELPRSLVQESFTQSTVEMVALTAEVEAKETQLRVQQRKLWGWVVAAAAVLACGMTSYAWMMWKLDEQNRKLVDDLPVIENVDLYVVADDMEFLRELQKSGLFAEEQSDVP